MAATIVPRVILGAPKKKKELGGFAQGIESALTGNPHFLTPNPLFAAAQLAANTRAVGAVTARNDAWRALLGVLQHLRDYVAGIVEISPTNAISVIESSGMKVPKQATRHKPHLAVQQGDISSVVTLIAKAIADNAVYYWEYSLDQKSWTTVPEGFGASTEISGLTAGQTYYFRFRGLTRQGKTDYSQVVSFLVK
jgi:hypothetical protein